MNRSIVNRVAAVTAILTLGATIAAGAIRLNRMEERTNKVDTMEYRTRVVFIYLQLKDPNGFKQALELAK